MAHDQYLALPSKEKPWYLLPVDDAGPFDYFVNYILSSRRQKRRWGIALLCIVTRVGAYRLWPWVAPILARVLAK